MATMDRFREMLRENRVKTDEGSVELSAQIKYDFLAAVHTMEQIEKLQKVIENRRNKRAALREKIATSCFNALKVLEDKEKLKDVKSLDAALRVLGECRTEMIKLASSDHEDDKLAKEIQDGVSAGR